MNLQHLRYFVETAHTKNYNQAAERLHITQPSLSYALKELEEELGVPLFTKVGRTNVLTSYGERFLSYAEGALKTLDLGVEAVSSSVYEETVIRLGFLRFLGIGYVPRLIDAFMKENPRFNVRFECETGSTKLLLDGLNTKRFDAVFCAPAKHVQKYGTCVGIQRLYLIVPKGHPLSGRKSVRLSETFSYPYIYYAKGSGMRHIIENSQPGLSEKLDIRYELMEENVVAGFVASGLGIGIVPQMHILETLPLVRLEIQDPSAERDIYMLSTVTREMTPALQAFLQFAAKRAAAGEYDVN